MKRIFLYIFSATLLLSMSVSCSKTDIVRGQGMGGEIYYDVIQTKSAVEYSKTDKFISYAWMVPDGYKWGASNNYDFSKPYISNVEISYTGDVWKNETKSFYWPKEGSLTFLAFSPSSIASEVRVSSKLGEGIMLDSWNVAEKQDIDFMVADVQSGKTANEVYAGYTGVPTVFRHKLAKLVGFKVNLLRDNGKSYTYHLMSIKVKNYSQKGSFISGISPSSILIGNWTVESGAKYSYTWYDDATGVEFSYNASASTAIPSDAYPDGIMLLPQIFANPGTSPDYTAIPYLEINYTIDKGSTTDNVTAKASLYSIFGSTVGVSMNKKITISIVINESQNLITWAPDQEDWTSGDDIDISF